MNLNYRILSFLPQKQYVTPAVTNFSSTNFNISSFMISKSKESFKQVFVCKKNYRCIDLVIFRGGISS